MEVHVVVAQENVIQYSGNKIQMLHEVSKVSLNEAGGKPQHSYYIESCKHYIKLRITV